MLINPKPRAYSLIFAFVLMTIMMITASTTIENTREKIALFSNIESNAKARLAAESAAEIAITRVLGKAPGYEIGEDGSFCIKVGDRDGDGAVDPGEADCQARGDFNVYSNAQRMDDDPIGPYYTPIPNTGSAASSGECSIREPDKEPNHSCNWNKILPNQAVTIPLYSVDPVTEELLIPTISPDFVNWKLKMRTPCINGALIDSCVDGKRATVDVRYTLAGYGDAQTDDDGDEDVTDDDASVVFWTIQGELDNGDKIELIANDHSIRNPFTDLFDRKYATDNTEIYESLINLGIEGEESYTVLKTEDLEEPYDELYKFSTSHIDYIPEERSIVKLELVLFMGSNLLDDEYGRVPYLEWQLLSDAGSPFADNKNVIVGEGYYKSSAGIFYFPYVIGRSSTGESIAPFALSN